MSETKKTLLPIPDAAEVSAYFAELQASNTSCPMCSNDRWEMFIGEDYVGVAQPVLQTNASTNKYQVRLLTLTCTRCHYVRQHLLNPFLDWLEKKKMAGGPKS